MGIKCQLGPSFYFILLLFLLPCRLLKAPSLSVNYRLVLSCLVLFFLVATRCDRPLSPPNPDCPKNNKFRPSNRHGTERTERKREDIHSRICRRPIDDRLGKVTVSRPIYQRRQQVGCRRCKTKKRDSSGTGIAGSRFGRLETIRIRGRIVRASLLFFHWPFNERTGVPNLSSSGVPTHRPPHNRRRDPTCLMVLTFCRPALKKTKRRDSR